LTKTTTFFIPVTIAVSPLWTQALLPKAGAILKNKMAALLMGSVALLLASCRESVTIMLGGIP
jgi:hypothetical protein